MAHSLRDAERLLRASVGRDGRHGPPGPAHVAVRLTDAGAPALERVALEVDPPYLDDALSIEGSALHEVALGGGPTVGFGAFLDGTQRSTLVAYVGDSVPLVFGSAGAVVRVRRERELKTWRSAPSLDGSHYLPFAIAGGAALEWARSLGVPLVDSLDGDGAASERHPQELLALARTAVQHRRAELETSLAQEWCASEQVPLYVDGGVSAALRGASSTLAVGVIKSHRTLYAKGAVGVVMGLAAEYRTSAFEIRSSSRASVASWYLRLRPTAGDPFFGLVRVEVARDSFTPLRADEVSRWILAERAPVALPDKRWSTMAYGIRDCEEYLRAVSG